MNLQIFTRVKSYTSKSVIGSFIFIFLLSSFAECWQIDLSRRYKDVRNRDVQSEAKTTNEYDLFEKTFKVESLQEIVVLNTEAGFVPSTIRVAKDANYTIHVVNINEKEKNVSFVMDQLNQLHGTYYGKKVTFKIQPKKEGVFPFQCPETSAEGRLVVVSPGPSVRTPAAEK